MWGFICAYGWSYMKAIVLSLDVILKKSASLWFI